ncbi:uncharacterized protein LAESUDRAFT_449331 [Laetiporus sulphureus 93-53]|uniref:Uncharacterized protein n=1 Tax=Laetiporus sulphureus 93-53 TaxID=1314785 RepID=A0A165BZ52_9APHY|nr:uncharacterized protein LAESUDRAFT_449331 [Laetiporus sulphureus 93-53]KZT01914.1 hypothetical protein LAESUDRAFT_449331 [Laetiporus sulphureus 93-53]
MAEHATSEPLKDKPPAYDTLSDRGSLDEEKCTPHKTIPASLRKFVYPPSNRRTSIFSFFPRRSSLQNAELKMAVIDILKDLAKRREIDDNAWSVLDHCADACRMNAGSFRSILQERILGDHTFIYWAVLKQSRTEEVQGSSNSEKSAECDLVVRLLELAAPLTDQIRAEFGLACLQTADQVHFEYVRGSPVLSPLSGTEEILLGSAAPPDQLDVEDDLADEHRFVVCFRVPMFAKRMWVVRRIELQFIARGRLWALIFWNPTEAECKSPSSRWTFIPDQWQATVLLVHPSPPTALDSRLTVLPAANSVPASSGTPRENTCHTTTGERAKKPLCWPLQTKHMAPSGVFSAPVLACFSHLQMNKSSYFAPDGTLNGRWQAVLAPPGTRCLCGSAHAT